MDAITAYQLTSMMKGVVDRGTASRYVNLPVPTAGKTGTTNESKDAWFIGFTSNIVAGCYIGYDRPRPMGRGAYGGTMCGPVFQSFMEKAVEKYGGGPFEVPEGGHFIKIDRFSGARLPDDASGEYVVAEFFRDGVDGFIDRVYDGGFAIGSDLPLFEEAQRAGVQVQTSTGSTVTVGPKASQGDLSTGGLY
jgi:penicillin-binding protein 1A